MNWTLTNLGIRWGINYFRTGEWQVVKERLDAYDHPKPHRTRLADPVKSYAPGRDLLFVPLTRLRPEQVRCVIVGQDPYPNLVHCTGLAFSVPGHVSFPPSLINIFQEYHDDLGLPIPTSGDLSPWVDQGVLLWNAYPSCEVGRPGSHHWEEWTYLTKELLDRLSSQGCVIVYLGRVAQSFAIPGYERQLFTSHPSPLGAHRGFLGSRVFSRVNELLDKPIDWKLP